MKTKPLSERQKIAADIVMELIELYSLEEWAHEI